MRCRGRSTYSFPRGKLAIETRQEAIRRAPGGVELRGGRGVEHFLEALALAGERGDAVAHGAQHVAVGAQIRHAHYRPVAWDEARVLTRLGQDLVEPVEKALQRAT